MGVNRCLTGHFKWRPQTLKAVSRSALMPVDCFHSTRCIPGICDATAAKNIVNESFGIQIEIGHYALPRPCVQGQGVARLWADLR